VKAVDHQPLLQLMAKEGIESYEERNFSSVVVACHTVDLTHPSGRQCLVAVFAPQSELLCAAFSW
jgi:hypothetical protein